MSNEVTLQDLIDKVQSDLVSSLKGTSLETEPGYPVFLIDNVELTLQVEVVKEGKAGIKIVIPTAAEAALEADLNRKNTHTIKLTLSPILSREELIKEIMSNPRLASKIRAKSRHVFVKDISDDDSEE